MPVPAITGRPKETAGFMTTTRGSDLGAASDCGVASEGVKLDRKTLRVPLNPLEIDANDLLHRLLSFARRINQIPITFDEQIQTIGLECLIDERALDVELSLYVVERGANLRKLDAVATTNGGQDMRLDEVDEGQDTASCGSSRWISGRERFDCPATGYNLPTTQLRKVPSGMRK